MRSLQRIFIDIVEEDDVKATVSKVRVVEFVSVCLLCHTLTSSRADGSR